MASCDTTFAILNGSILPLPYKQGHSRQSGWSAGFWPDHYFSRYKQNLKKTSNKQKYKDDFGLVQFDDTVDRKKNMIYKCSTLTKTTAYNSLV